MTELSIAALWEAGNCPLLPRVPLRTWVFHPQVVAQLHFGRQHPLGTLLYFRLLSHFAYYGQDAVRLHYPKREFWHLDIGYTWGWEQTEQLLAQAYVNLGNPPNTFLTEISRRALAEGWEEIVAQTCATLRAQKGKLTEAEILTLHEWLSQGDLDRHLAEELVGHWLGLPQMPHRAVGLFVAQGRAGLLDTALLTAAVQWLREVGLIRLREVGEGLEIWLDPRQPLREMLPRPAFRSSQRGD